MPATRTLRIYRRKIKGSRNDPCVFCQGKANSIDHIQPVSKRGPKKDINNWAPTCLKCNTIKSNNSILIALLNPKIQQKRKIEKLSNK